MHTDPLNRHFIRFSKNNVLQSSQEVLMLDGAQHPEESLHPGAWWGLRKHHGLSFNRDITFPWEIQWEFLSVHRQKKSFSEWKKTQSNPPKIADEIYVRTGNEFSVNNPQG